MPSESDRVIVYSISCVGGRVVFLPYNFLFSYPAPLITLKMRFRAVKWIMLGLILLLIAFFSFNIYILKVINRSEKVVVVHAESNTEDRIIANVKSLSPSHWQKNPEYDDVFYQLKLMFDPGVKPIWSKSPAQLWKLVNNVSPDCSSH